MSALNVFVRPGRVDILTDAATVAVETLELVRIGSKVHEHPDVPAVVAYRCNHAPFAEMVAAAFIQTPASSFDAIAFGLDETVAIIRKHAAGLNLSGLELVIAGLTDDGEAQAFLIVAEERAADLGVEPWQAIPIRGAFVAPLPEPDELATMGLEPGWTRDSDCENQGGALLDLQRALTPGIGGFVEQTTISRDGVEKRILKTWPDLVGSSLARLGAPPFEEIPPAAPPRISRYPSQNCLG